MDKYIMKEKKSFVSSFFHNCLPAAVWLSHDLLECRLHDFITLHDCMTAPLSSPHSHHPAFLISLGRIRFLCSLFLLCSALLCFIIVYSAWERHMNLFFASKSDAANRIIRIRTH